MGCSRKWMIFRAFCKNCADELNALESGKRFCGKCQALIENDGLQFKGEWYHAYHFNCEKCKYVC